MIVVMLIVWGLCFGSFASATVWRMRKRRNFVTERSECEHCHHVLAWYDLIPVLSWLSLRGRCRYCHKRLSIGYPLVELLTAGLFVAIYHYWPESLVGWQWLRLAVWLTLAVGFVALAIFDCKWFLLPDKIVIPLLILVLAERTGFAVYTRDANIIRETVLGIICGGGIFWLLFEFSKGKWIGGGDVKLGFVIGAAVGGPLKALLVLFLASCIGSLYGIAMLAASKLKRSGHIPFGPFLMAATIPVFLFGERIIDWYYNLFLL